MYEKPYFFSGKRHTADRRKCVNMFYEKVYKMCSIQAVHHITYGYCRFLEKEHGLADKNVLQSFGQAFSKACGGLGGQSRPGSSL